jgi:1,4-dihydroxy-2-naphthoate polyprenyltransferase
MKTASAALATGWKPWIQTIRPKTLTIGFMPVFSGTLLAYSRGVPMQWSLALFAWIVALFVQTGSHLINDALDFKRGADTDDRIGPARATQLGLLSFKQAYGGGLGCLALALLFGIPLIQVGGLPILMMLLASVTAAYCYTGGPLPLAYTGLSELFVVIFYGWVCSGAAYYVQGHSYDSAPFLLGLQVGLLSNIMLTINNCRDRLGDARVNKRTLAVRFGETFGKAEITFMALVPFLLNLFWWPLSYATLLPFLALPFALKLVRQIWKHEPGPCYNQFFGLGALLHFSFGLLLSIAFLIRGA